MSTKRSYIVKQTCSFFFWWTLGKTDVGSSDLFSPQIEAFLQVIVSQVFTGLKKNRVLFFILTEVDSLLDENLKMSVLLNKHE